MIKNNIVPDRNYWNRKNCFQFCLFAIYFDQIKEIVYYVTCYFIKFFYLEQNELPVLLVMTFGSVLHMFVERFGGKFENSNSSSVTEALIIVVLEVNVLNGGADSSFESFETKVGPIL